MDTVELRPATDRDAQGLNRLAQLDSAAIPAGRLLVAESGGRLVAAVALDSGEAIADPFTATAHLVSALRAQLARPRGGMEWTPSCQPRLAT